jgi:UDP-2-acetamido-2,6-beta-L-arabino-hexul-4-ose reductase
MNDAAPRTVLVTGSAGMLGFHMRAHLHVLEGVEVLEADRAEFAQPELVAELVARAGAIVHLAGINRGSDAEVEHGNVQIAEQLASALRQSGRTPALVFSSSTHIERDTPYGRGKRAAGDILRAWASDAGADYHELVLPHVFGETGQPFYNSVVHTFCAQLAGGEALTIDQPDGALELRHAGSVCRAILGLLGLADAAAIGPMVQEGERTRLLGQAMTVGELAELLTAQAQQYFEAREVPTIGEELELALFNNLRSAAFPQRYPVALELHTDPRGSLFEAVRSHRAGQTFFSTTRPGITRGNHFHFGKVERFLVVGGQARIRIRRLFDDQVHVFDVDGSAPAYVDMPTLHTHDITNTGDGELLTLFWAHEFFDSARPDTYAEPVDLSAPTPANR